MQRQEHTHRHRLKPQSPPINHPPSKQRSQTQPVFAALTALPCKACSDKFTIDYISIKCCPWLPLPFLLSDTKAIIILSLIRWDPTHSANAHPWHNNPGQINRHINRHRRVSAPSARHKLRRWHHVGLLMLALVEAGEGSTWHLWWRIEPRPLLCRWGWEMSL